MTDDATWVRRLDWLARFDVHERPGAELAVTDQNGQPALILDNATLRFVPCRDGRPEGLGGIDVTTANRAAILDAARARDAITAPDQVYLCGMRINLR